MEHEYASSQHPNFKPHNLQIATVTLKPVLNATVVELLSGNLSLSSLEWDIGKPADAFETETEDSSLLSKFKSSYELIHGYLCLVICVFGLITNILNIIVLTRKNLISATNSILTGLAVADMLVMLDYIPYSFHEHIHKYDRTSDKFSYNWALFTLFHAHFSNVFYTISTWLTVLLAVWRYVSVKFPTQSRSWCTLSSARRLILGTYLTVPFFCTPMYLTFKIFGTEDGQHYYVSYSELATIHNKLLQRINFWVYSFGSKLVPCVLLTYLSWALIRAVWAAEKRKKRLKGNSYSLPTVSTAGPPKISSNAPETSDDSSTRELNSVPFRKVKSQGATPMTTTGNCNSGSSTSHGDRATRMLLAILILFLATQLPNGLVTLLRAISDDANIDKLYHSLGILFDMLGLVNSAVNFILYCTMSEQFRYTFAKLFFL